MDAEEGEAVPACGEPQGGATTTPTCEGDEPHVPQLAQGHPRSCDGNPEHQGVDVGEPWDDNRNNTTELNVDNNGEDCSSEEGAVGGSRVNKALAMNSTSSSESCIPTPSCRICFQGAEQGNLLNPCRCDGSVRYTHQHCLLKWISERGCWSCELCCYRFNIVAINMKRPWQWQSISITLVEKVQMVAVFLGSLFLMASITWLLWSALSPQALWQRRDVLFQICYGMYGFMDLVCVGLIVHEGAAVHSVFLRWRAVNLHWDVQSYDKAADVEETDTSRTTSLVPRSLWLPLANLGPGGPLQTPSQPGPHRRCCCPRWPHVCPSVGPLDGPSQDGGSGEVVVRVTSV